MTILIEAQKQHGAALVKTPHITIPHPTLAR